jgi:hypothetical protein
MFTIRQIGELYKELIKRDWIKTRGILSAIRHAAHHTILYIPSNDVFLGDTLELQTALTRENAGSRFLEFAKLDEAAITRTQIEIRGHLVFMRAKRRSYVFSY